MTQPPFSRQAWRAAVALLTAEAAGVSVEVPTLCEGCDLIEVIDVLRWLAARMLTGFPDPGAAGDLAALRYIGAYVAGGTNAP